ncbi:tyrosine-type recombinase/integrase [Ferruginivarius sediminum]|uniref:DUF4102 domain-containing protein n=1 Tax=Ferruginivarius sediminum TaxID=2661937 RepID=A0A369TCW8_9PROT|nr:site-specific integrase [Ferruginivarius sediminum]RDD62007.1 DUF4102 domain-containing protein [Ferruginivarius sediminum]
MARKLTAKFLGDENAPSRGALPEAGKPQIDHWDSVAPGLGVRVSKTGRRTFVIWYRLDGKPRRDTLKPPYPALSLEDAREEARATARDVAAGRDPRLSGRDPRRHHLPQPDAEPERPQTYAEAVAEYVRRYQRGQERNKTAHEVERALLRAGAGWADKPLADVRAKDVRAVLEAIRDGDDERAPAPYMANRTFAYMRTFFAWCAEPGIEKVAKSPLDGLRKPWSGEESRDRVYTDDELARLWQAADGLGRHTGALVKLMILTGKRKSAVAAMKWSEIGGDGIWTPPQDRRRKRGNKRTHVIPLPPAALAIIRALPRATGNGHVFPGRKDGQHLEPGSRLQRTLRERADISDFAFHPIRHTVETRLGALGVPPHVRDLLLDHVPNRGAGAGYDHYSYGKEMREALEAWELYIANMFWPINHSIADHPAATRRLPSNVVELSR